MTITILQTISNTLTEDYTLISSSTTETFLLTPAENKIFRNRLTGALVRGNLWVNKKAQIENYEEIDDPELDK